MPSTRWIFIFLARSRSSSLSQRAETSMARPKRPPARSARESSSFKASVARVPLPVGFPFRVRCLAEKTSHEHTQKKGVANRSQPPLCIWSGREDLNLRPPEPHSGALPDCATSRIRPKKNSVCSTARTKKPLFPACINKFISPSCRASLAVQEELF